MPFDVVPSLERAHLARLLVWAIASLVTGVALVAWLRFSRRGAPFLEHFAIQTAAWGAVDLAICALAARSPAVRDAAGVAHLQRVLWLNIGLDAGYVMVGITLCLVGWRLGRRWGLVGAGAGVALQGTALFALDLLLVNQLSAYP